MTSVTVVLPSRDRPRRLALTLRALEFQHFESFDVLVVGPEGAVPRAYRDRVGHVVYDGANLSRARNHGIAAARGAVIAFCDDDAVPEPGWLAALVAGFSAPDIGGVGGVVRGRSGVHWQWRAVASDALGADHPLPDPGEDAAPVVPEPAPGLCLKTHGTCCAFLRRALLSVGGFDPAYRFFLDETDLDRRLAAAGWRLALAPRAVVHHAYAASERRDARRVPRDLREIAASHAAFLDRHAPAGARSAAERAFAAQQRRRLLGHVLGLRLTPLRARRIWSGFRAGLAAGHARRPEPGLAGDLAGDPEPAGQARPFLAQGGPSRAPGPGAARGLRALFVQSEATEAGIGERALRAAGQGAEVHLLDFRPGIAPLTVAFGADGIWRHRGGLWGRGARPGRRLVPRRFAARVAEEIARLGGPGGFDLIVGPETLPDPAGMMRRSIPGTGLAEFFPCDQDTIGVLLSPQDA